MQSPKAVENLIKFSIQIKIYTLHNLKYHEIFVGKNVRISNGDETDIKKLKLYFFFCSLFTRKN